MPSSDGPLPLAGLRVLDLGQIYNGAYAGFLLAQAGADVVKVEPPAGDNLRNRPKPTAPGIRSSRSTSTSAASAST